MKIHCETPDLCNNKDFHIDRQTDGWKDRQVRGRHKNHFDKASFAKFKISQMFPCKKNFKNINKTISNGHLVSPWDYLPCPSRLATD